MKPTVSPDENRIVVEPRPDVIGCYTTRLAALYPGLHYKPRLGAILSYPFIAPFGKQLYLYEKSGINFSRYKKSDKE